MGRHVIAVPPHHLTMVRKVRHHIRPKPSAPLADCIVGGLRLQPLLRHCTCDGKARHPLFLLPRLRRAPLSENRSRDRSIYYLLGDRHHRDATVGLSTPGSILGL